MQNRGNYSLNTSIQALERNDALFYMKGMKYLSMISRVLIKNKVKTKHY